MSVSGNGTGIRFGVATSTNRPATPFDGQVIYETDTDRLAAYDSSAWAYKNHVVVCTSSTRPSSPFEGQIIYETDTDDIAIYNGSAWVLFDTAFQTYTPTYTNITAGNGTTTARYIQIGKLVVVNLRFVLGSTSSVGTNPKFSAPVTAAMTIHDQSQPLGVMRFHDSGTANYFGFVSLENSTTLFCNTYNAAGTTLAEGSVSATNPFTWTTSDGFFTIFMYEAA